MDYLVEHIKYFFTIFLEKIQDEGIISAIFDPQTTWILMIIAFIVGSMLAETDKDLETANTIGKIFAFLPRTIIFLYAILEVVYLILGILFYIIVGIKALWYLA